MNKYSSNKATAVLIVIALFSSHIGAATFTVNSIADAVDDTLGDGVCETTVTGVCTLRAAIQETNALAGLDIINLPSGIYVLTISGSGEQAGDLNIKDDLEIVGSGTEETVIDGGRIDRVLLIGTIPSVSNISVSLSHLTVTNGRPGFKNGGGIFSQLADVTLDNVNVYNNTSGVQGGGIYNDVISRLTIINSTVRNNEAIGAGGGGAIWNDGKLNVIDSTITDNRATSSIGGPGGGISTHGDLLVLNSTISGNTATGRGGGIFATNYSNVTIVKSSTIAENASGFVAGAIATNYDLDIDHSLITGNLPFNCGESAGTITSLGNNLDSDSTCGLATSSDLNNLDPLIGPLKDNGGPTETHALLDGSPAIDAGAQNCTDAAGAPLLSDQRGGSRPVDGNGDGVVACDIGSYEAQQTITTISLDIKPHSQTNKINPRSNGVIPAAVLTSVDFDALLVDPNTVKFGPAGAPKAHTQIHVEDVDHDGDMDFIFHFKTQETGIKCGDTEATLTGNTWSGTPISGTDSVNTVGCK